MTRDVRWTRALLVALFIMSLSACANGDNDNGPAAAAEFFMTANESTFDLTTFTVPADSAFQVVFTNNDEDVAHSISIYADEAATDRVFQGEIFEGSDRRTYDVPSLDAGRYHFRCEVHPDQMTGTLVAQ